MKTKYVGFEPQEIIELEKFARQNFFEVLFAKQEKRDFWSVVGVREGAEIWKFKIEIVNDEFDQRYPLMTEYYQVM